MIDYADYLRYIAALIFVIAMIMGLAVLLRRFGNSRMMGGTGLKRADKRLRIVEVQPIDPRRRLVLIEQDDVEHLVMIGPERDLVVSSNRPKPVTSPSPGDDQLTMTPAKTDREPPGKGRYIPGSRPSDLDDGAARS
ncbi:MAG: flagellar biosynthetic protein FliO [Pseudomonadota bacterium]